MKILVTDGIDKKAKERLIKNGYEIEEKFYERDDLKIKIQTIDAIIVRSATIIDKEILDMAAKTGRLKLVIRAGVGLDNIDLNYARKLGIGVKNTPNASSNAVAELVLGEMLVLARNIKIANMKLNDGLWDKKNLKGTEIFGKTLGIIGFGRIARNLAKKAKALGMDILYTDLFPVDGLGEDFVYTDIDTILMQADYITLHTPLTDDTRGMFDKTYFEKMKNTAYLINCARGGIVVEDDLIEALDTGMIAGASLDCFVNEPQPKKRLITHPLVSVTPHIGAATVEAQERIGDEIVGIFLNDYPVDKNILM